MDIETALHQLIRKEGLIEPGEKVLVGVSGGIDSTVLVHLLSALAKRIPHELILAHINHMVRTEEADRDEAFVRDLGARLSLPVHVHRVDVKAEAARRRRSLQHTGRDVRYEYFHELASRLSCDRIAVAHNMDDQVETLLLRIVKGTGIRGLSAIPVKRGRIIRPLLRTPRASIEAYARERGITWVEDSSNKGDAYERNYLRHRIVPLIEKLNPNFRSRVVALLGDFTALNHRIEEEAVSFLAFLAVEEEGGIRLPLSEFHLLEGDVRYRVVAQVCARLAADFIPLREHMLLIEKAIASRRPNVTVTLAHSILAKKVYGALVFTTALPAPPVTGLFPVREGTTRIPELSLTLEVSVEENRAPAFTGDTYLAYLDASKTGVLAVRTFRDGDRFQPLGMGQTVKLKDYFISRKVPRDKRRLVPLLLSGSTIAWVVGERIDERFKVTGETTRVLKITALRDL